MQTGISGILGIPECPVVSSSFIYQGFRSTILSSFRFVSFFFSLSIDSIHVWKKKEEKRREEKRKGNDRERRKKKRDDLEEEKYRHSNANSRILF